MTKWTHITRTDWAETWGLSAAPAEFVDFFGLGAEVGVVWPDREVGEADKEVARTFLGRVNLVAGVRSAVLVVHPAEDQMRVITDGKLDEAQRALVVLWSRDRVFEGWLASRGSRSLAHPESSAQPVDLVLEQALFSVARSRNPANGIRGGYGKDYAVDALRKLQRAGYEISGAGLERSGFNAGLRWSEVKQLRVYADGLTAGRRFVTKATGYREDVVTDWQQQAERSRSSGRPPQFFTHDGSGIRT